MAVILSNTQLNKTTFAMTLHLGGDTPGTCGQFYMVYVDRGTTDPILGRPISICDTDIPANTVTLLYETVGRGTRIMSQMEAGKEVRITGPFGKGFPHTDSDVTLVGGGIGTAPLYLFAKEQKVLFPSKRIVANLGFRDNDAVVLYDEFKKICDEVTLNIGGYVTDDVNFSADSVFYTCGTPPMMAAVCKGALANGKTLYVSLDKHMACGVGACLACTCKTKDGTRRRACKDGPVFLATDVFDTENGRFYE